MRNYTHKAIVYGKGIIDVNIAIDGDEHWRAAYKSWYRMLMRCYYVKYKGHYGTYKDCTVCNEWLLLPNFKLWFDKNYVKGYDLDKDILFRNNKVYSPDTCCFVPSEINKLIIKRNKKRGSLPIGVYQPKEGLFLAQMGINGKTKTIGCSKSANQAFLLYKSAKEAHIKEVAQKYYDEGKIAKRVYDALMKYEVEITD